MFPLHWFVEIHACNEHEKAQEDVLTCMCRGKKKPLTECCASPYRGELTMQRGEDLAAKSRISMCVFFLIPTEISGAIICSFNRASSWMKVRQTRGTARIKTTGVDKEKHRAQSQLSTFPYAAAQPALCRGSWQQEQSSRGREWKYSSLVTHRGDVNTFP